MRMILTVAMILACAACQPYADPTVAETAVGQGPAQSDCQNFSAAVTAAGTPKQASGQACQQGNGAWRVVQNTPGLPTQEYLVPRPGQNTTEGAGSSQPPGQSANAQPAANPPPACTTYNAPVTVGGQQQQATVEACPQPDGSWQITQNTPGLPQQVYTIPAPASSPYAYDYGYPADYFYPDFSPYWAGAPWFFGLAPSIVVVKKFPHFRHGFGRGFAHGSGRGSGFGHGGGFRGDGGHGGGGGGWLASHGSFRH
jgi:surface antigen